MRVSPELQELALALHKRRAKAGDTGTTYETALIEVALFKHYELTLDVNKLVGSQKRLVVQASDEAGRTIRVAEVKQWPARLFWRSLGADAYVFGTYYSGEITLHGWLSAIQVEEAPVFWLDKDGKRVSYAHEIERDFLAPLPDTLHFEDCPHDQKFGGLWDYGHDGWRCFGCERLYYDAANQERIPRQDKEYYDRRRNSISAEEAGLIRPTTECEGEPES